LGKKLDPSPPKKIISLSFFFFFEIIISLACAILNIIYFGSPKKKKKALKKKNIIYLSSTQHRMKARAYFCTAKQAIFSLNQYVTPSNWIIGLGQNDSTFTFSRSRRYG